MSKRGRRGAFQRGLETAEWIVVACGLCIVCIFGYGRVSTHVQTQAETAVDCLGGIGICGGGGGATGGGATGGGATGGGATGGGATGGGATGGGATGGGATGGGATGGGATGGGATGGGATGGGATGATTQASTGAGEPGWGDKGTFSGGVVSFGKGFVIDGAGGALSGLGDLAVGLYNEPGATLAAVGSGIGNAVLHPIDTVTSIKDHYAKAIEEDGARGSGKAMFAVVTAALAVTKVAQVARAGKAAKDLAEAGKAGKRADALNDAEKMASIECKGGVCTRPGQCFGAGTLVATATGEKAIEKVVTGDVVLARDPESGETRFERVAQTFVREAAVVALVLSTAGNAHATEKLTTTAEHPFHVHGAGFRPVADLLPGDEIDTASGTAKVLSLASLPEKTTVFNFEVENAHTYFVGHTAAWVHNDCDTPQTPQSPLEKARGKTIPMKDGSTLVGPEASLSGRAVNLTSDNALLAREADAGFRVGVHSTKDSLSFYADAAATQPISTRAAAVRMWKGGYRGGDVTLQACECGLNTGLTKGLRRELNNLPLDKPVGNITAPTTTVNGYGELTAPGGVWKIMD